jgi:hypothetical protein
MWVENLKIQLDKGWILCYNRVMNSNQMKLIEAKYGNLIHKIGHHISGDAAICDHDDNTQDLWIAVMDAIRGYERKEGKPFEEFYNERGFDKYIKTCLWNLKNSKGARITKRSNLNNGTVSVENNEEILHIEETSMSTEIYDQMLDDLPTNMTDHEVEVIKMLVESPDYITEDGRVNIQALSRSLDKGWGTTRRIVSRIGDKIKNSL